MLESNKESTGIEMISTSRYTHVTKRMILSNLNKIFDLLGFLAPVLIKGIIFLQQLWQFKRECNLHLSNEVQLKYELCHQYLEEIRSITTHRKCTPNSTPDIEMHGFCDVCTQLR